MKSVMISIVILVFGVAIGFSIRGDLQPTHSEAYINGYLDSARTNFGFFCEQGVFPCERVGEIVNDIEAMLRGREAKQPPGVTNLKPVRIHKDEVRL